MGKDVRMPNLILFDLPHLHQQLCPLTFTRPIAEIRCGIVTLREKWEWHFGKASWLTAHYLSEVFPTDYQEQNLYINASLLASPALVEQIKLLPKGQGLRYGSTLLAFTGGILSMEQISSFASKEAIEVSEAQLIERPWHIFQYNGEQIKFDFSYLKATQPAATLTDPHTVVYGKENLFIGENTKIKAAVLNAEGGPIYIGPNCDVQEGSLIRGPFALCEGSTVNMGAKLRGDTTVGPFCKVGGEISNSVIFGYSNKGHDGFLGNSVLGEWCNLGADTNTSNLKNNYSSVSIYSYAEDKMVDTGTQFCGLTMGDHSKAGINTMFNTGTVVGVNANIFDGGFPPKHVPSFAWGGNTDERYQFDKAIETAQRVMERRGKKLNEMEIRVLRNLFQK